MDVFVARQPIFKRNMQLYGYELLYRRSRNNYFEGEDDTLSTAELISNSFLVIGYDELIENTKGFINFSAELLMRDMPLMLPRDKVVIELLERAQITDELLLVLKKHKSMGYTLALDDFALDMEDMQVAELLELADIVKIEFPNVRLDIQRSLIRKYKGRIKFLAERIETREEFRIALEMGYTLFQGYFFSKPVIVNAKEIHTVKSNAGLAIQELSRNDPNLKYIERIFEQDVGLSYKLLKLANSAFFSTGRQVKSIRQAIMHIGTDELNNWLHLIFLKSMQSVENKELIKTSIIRAKLLSLLVNEKCKEADCFFVGMFSSLDILLNQDMEQALGGLPLSQTVKDTLLGRDTQLTPYLRIVLNLELGNWETVEILLHETGITRKIYMDAYLCALRWQQSLPF